MSTSLTQAQIINRLRDVFAWADTFGYHTLRDQARYCLHSLPRLQAHDTTLAHMLDVWAMTQEN